MPTQGIKKVIGIGQGARETCQATFGARRSQSTDPIEIKNGYQGSDRLTIPGNDDIIATFNVMNAFGQFGLRLRKGSMLEHGDLL
jgi:hypothetical protein